MGRSYARLAARQAARLAALSAVASAGQANCSQARGRASQVKQSKHGGNRGRQSRGGFYVFFPMKIGQTDDESKGEKILFL